MITRTSIYDSLALARSQRQGYQSQFPCSTFKTAGVALLILGAGQHMAHALTSYMKTLGGTDYDEARAVATTSDGSIVLAGFSNSFNSNSYDVFVTKLSSDGLLTWSRTLGGSNDDRAFALGITADDAIAVAGRTASYGAGNNDVILAKWWNNGTLAWVNTFGGTGYDAAYALTTLSDGGIVAAGYTDSFGVSNGDVFLAKWEGDGTLAWSKTFGGAGFDEAYALTTTPDGDIIVAGALDSSGPATTDAFLAKWRADGTLVWAQVLRGAAYDEIYALSTTLSGEIMTAGRTTSFGAGSYDVLLAKWLSDGTLVWAMTLGGGNNDFARALVTLSDGVMTAGYTDSFGAGSDDILFTRWWNNGTLAWAQTFGGASFDGAYGLTSTPDQGVVAAGYTINFGAGSIDFLLARLTASKEQIADCPALQNMTSMVSNITSFVNITSANAIEQDWVDGFNQGWSMIEGTVNPSLLELCQGESSSDSITTGIATTGLSTTGNATTGGGTTGNLTTGFATTGLITTGFSTTTGSTTGLMNVTPSSSSLLSTPSSHEEGASSSAVQFDLLPLILGVAGGVTLLAIGSLGVMCLVKRRSTIAQSQAVLELDTNASKPSVSPPPSHYEPIRTASHDPGSYSNINEVVPSASSAEAPYALIEDI